MLIAMLSAPAAMLSAAFLPRSLSVLLLGLLLRPRRFRALLLGLRLGPWRLYALRLGRFHALGLCGSGRLHPRLVRRALLLHARRLSCARRLWGWLDRSRRLGPLLRNFNARSLGRLLRLRGARFRSRWARLGLDLRAGLRKCAGPALRLLAAFRASAKIGLPSVGLWRHWAARRQIPRSKLRVGALCATTFIRNRRGGSGVGLARARLAQVLGRGARPSVLRAKMRRAVVRREIAPVGDARSIPLDLGNIARRRTIGGSKVRLATIGGVRGEARTAHDSGAILRDWGLFARLIEPWARFASAIKIGVVGRRGARSIDIVVVNHRGAIAAVAAAKITVATIASVPPIHAPRIPTPVMPMIEALVN